MSKAILLTAALDDSAEVLELLEEINVELMHFPLEHYRPVSDKTDIEETFSQIDEFENIIYGSVRNARYFIEQVESLGEKGAVRKRLNLTLDEETAAFLEEVGIPAVCTYAGGKSINLVEFMLRLRRMGATLYPCGSHKKEEIPGFLEELDIPVKELELFDLEGPGEDKLLSFRKKIARSEPDAIFFHSRRSVTRTLAAFPDLNYEELTVISADKGVTKKLEDKGIAVTHEAEGNWKSMVDAL